MNFVRYVQAILLYFQTQLAFLLLAAVVVMYQASASSAVTHLCIKSQFLL